MRNHVVHVSDSGLVTIAGGKWTTYRSMAKETLDAAVESCKQLQPTGESGTDGLLLEGAHGWTPSNVSQIYQLIIIELRKEVESDNNHIYITNYSYVHPPGSRFRIRKRSKFLFMFIGLKSNLNFDFRFRITSLIFNLTSLKSKTQFLMRCLVAVLNRLLCIWPILTEIVPSQ